MFVSFPKMKLERSCWIWPQDLNNVQIPCSICDRSKLRFKITFGTFEAQNLVCTHWGTCFHVHTVLSFGSLSTSYIQVRFITPVFQPNHFLDTVQYTCMIMWNISYKKQEGSSSRKRSSRSHQNEQLKLKLICVRTHTQTDYDGLSFGVGQGSKQRNPLEWVSALSWPSFSTSSKHIIRG